MENKIPDTPIRIPKLVETFDLHTPTTDTQIDALVYKLYNLTDGEIKIVEGTIL